MMQAFLLGLSNGGACVAYCAPALVPFILGGGGQVAFNLALILRFLLGRLAGYLLFGLLVWWASRPLLQFTGRHDLITGSMYMILAILLVLYGFIRVERACPSKGIKGVMEKVSGRLPFLLPVLAGFATGLSFCPPFLLATADAAHKGSLQETLCYFLLFFIGTSLFFLPFPFLALLRRARMIKVVGRMAAGVMGLYYFYSGLMMVIGGVYRI